MLMSCYHDRQESILCKKQCRPRDTHCLANNTQTITFQHISVPTIKRLERPLVLSRMQAVAVSGDWSYRTSFEIVSGDAAGIFGLSQQQNTGNLELTRPISGPARYSLQMRMSVVTLYSQSQRQLTTRHLAFIEISVSAYEF